MHGISRVCALALGVLLTSCAPDQPSTTAPDPAEAAVQNPGDAHLRDHPVRGAPTTSLVRGYAVEAQTYPGGAFVVTDFGSPPPGDAASVIRSLEPQARAGSATASYEIFLKINQCMNLLKESQRGEPAEAVTGKDCRSLGADDYAQAAEWLGLAAEQGSLGAQLLYASSPETIVGDASEMLRNPAAVAAYKESAASYLRTAAARGSIDALNTLGNAYMNGIMVDQDLTSAYAYFLTINRVDPEQISRRKIDAFENQLSPSQIAEATQKSEKIYNECCHGKDR